MKRKVFLTMVSVIAMGVGFIALVFPAALLESKGVAYNAATKVWMTETGLLLISIGLMAFLVRNDEDSKTLRSFLFGNLIIQIGLFVIELLAYFNSIITKPSGIVPNLALHILLAVGFIHFWKTMHLKDAKSN